MNSRARQDHLIRHLRRNGLTTSETLAQAVGTSRRTVLRDLSCLRDEGYLIHSEPGPGGGLLLDPQAARSGPRLSVSEVFALIVTVSAMQIARDVPFAELADTGLAKIEKSLSADQLRDLRALLEGLHVGRLSPLQDLSDRDAMDPALLPCFEAGFLDRQPIRFAYRDAKGNQTRRQVEPQAMLILPPLWYLVGWDPEKGDFRHFRMDRIARPEIVPGPPFRRRRVPFDADVCPFTELTRQP
ncbi:helix-turn-helix transcriptional regulator [Pararhodobacter marinus]|uniref:helix-turn-helix transcriptional regulator n=1 Tax=Pararhodobacter marinus TaxID=2184063 RepID=UPI003513602D